MGFRRRLSQTRWRWHLGRPGNCQQRGYCHRAGLPPTWGCPPITCAGNAPARRESVHKGMPPPCPSRTPRGRGRSQPRDRDPTSLSSAGVPVSTCSGPRPTESPERKKVCLCVPMCTCVHTLRPMDTSPTGRVIPAGTRAQSTRREGGCEGRSTGCSRVSCTGEAEDRHVWWPGEWNVAGCGPAGRLPTSPAPSVCSRCLALPGQGRALPSHGLPSDGDRTTRTPSAPASPHYPTG